MIRVKRKLSSTDVVDALTDLFIMRGPPEYIRSANGADFIAKKVRAWIGAVGVKTAFIALGSPWEMLLRELQRSPSGRAAERRTLLLASRGTDLSSRDGIATTTWSGHIAP